MKKYKNRVIAVGVIAAVLIFAFFMGGNPPAHDRLEPQSTPQTAVLPTETDLPDETAEAPQPTETAPQASAEPDKPTAEQSSADNADNGDNTAADVPQKEDKYHTAPPPDGKPLPVEPQDAEVTEKQYTCTLSVRCDTILDNMSSLKPEKAEIVPADGVIFAEQTVVFYDGESVYNLLKREMKKNKIHMEFVNTPIYNSAYIEGIANLYEFDCGELSGWMYKVNGWFPNYGCSRYSLKPGDRVEWVYTCDLGRDVGGADAAGGGQNE